METELEQDIGDNLEMLLNELVEEGHDGDVVAELIVRTALKLWPELQKTFWVYDDDQR